VVVAIYALSLVGVHLLAKSTPLPAVDLSKFESEDTVVQVKLQELKTVANRLTVNVQVYPKNSLFDKKFGVLTADAAVRLYPDNDLGDLIYPAGKNPGQVATTIQADGDPANWPFDSYKTEPIAATVFTGTGATRETASAYVGVSGQLDGWDATVTRVHDSEDGSDASVQNDVIITLNRSQGVTDLRFRDLSGSHLTPRACSGCGHPHGHGPDVVHSAVHGVVRRDAVRDRPAAQHSARQPTVRFLDRPSCRALGVDRADHRDDAVPLRLVAKQGQEDADEVVIRGYR
jgi:Domain of unknown function (DUF4436)